MTDNVLDFDSGFRRRALLWDRVLLRPLPERASRLAHARRLPDLVATPDTAQRRGLKKETPPALPCFGRRSPRREAAAHLSVPFWHPIVTGGPLHARPGPSGPGKLFQAARFAR